MKMSSVTRKMRLRLCLIKAEVLKKFTVGRFRFRLLGMSTKVTTEVTMGVIGSMMW